MQKEIRKVYMEVVNSCHCVSGGQSERYNRKSPKRARKKDKVLGVEMGSIAEYGEKGGGVREVPIQSRSIQGRFPTVCCSPVAVATATKASRRRISFAPVW